MPHTMSGQTGSTPAGAAAQAVAQYRFRIGAKVSAWMSADQLKDAALHGELPPDSEVQQSGHAEWVVASNVRGLAFPTLVAAETAPVAEVAAQLANGANLRQPRFSTFRDLLGLYANADVEVNIPDPAEFSPAKLCAAGSDHFEVILETGRSRVFLPYSRINAIWVTETSTNMTLTFRESHRITIELTHPKH